MDALLQTHDELIRSAARRLKGHQRRLFQAQVANALCGGSPRAAERRFGWGRDSVATGQNEARTGLRCAEDFPARGKLPCEVKDPQLAADIRRIVEPHTLADPEAKSARRYTNLSAREVRQALKEQKGYSGDRLPSERAMRDILNRLGYRLKRIQKAKPLKRHPFQHVREVGFSFVEPRACRWRRARHWEPFAAAVSSSGRAASFRTSSS